MKRFNAGDWVFSEFKLQQVMQVEDGKVTEVSDGSFTKHGRSLLCFPVTMRMKHWADFVAHHADKVHTLPMNRALNHPEIHGIFQEAFEKGAKLIEQDTLPTFLYDEVARFYRELERGTFSCRQATVPVLGYEIKIFRE